MTSESLSVRLLRALSSTSRVAIAVDLLVVGVAGAARVSRRVGSASGARRARRADQRCWLRLFGRSSRRDSKFAKLRGAHGDVPHRRVLSVRRLWQRHGRLEATCEMGESKG
jgi:hypothetical protein